MVINIFIREKYEDMTIDFQKPHQPRIIKFFVIIRC